MCWKKIWVTSVLKVHEIRVWNKAKLTKKFRKRDFVMGLARTRLEITDIPKKLGK